MISLLDMFLQIIKERIEDFLKRNSSIDEVVDLLVHRNLENITLVKGNPGLISINSSQNVWKQCLDKSKLPEEIVLEENGINMV